MGGRSDPVWTVTLSLRACVCPGTGVDDRNEGKVTCESSVVLSPQYSRVSGSQQRSFYRLKVHLRVNTKTLIKDQNDVTPVSHNRHFKNEIL